MKVTAEIERALLERAAASSESAEQLASWLSATHGIVICARAVRKRVAQVRLDRAEATKAIVREKLAREVPDDLARLEVMAAKAWSMAKKNEKDPKVWALLVEQVRKITETKLHFSGADVPDDSLTTLAAAAQRLRMRVDRSTG